MVLVHDDDLEQVLRAGDGTKDGTVSNIHAQKHSF